MAKLIEALTKITLVDYGEKRMKDPQKYHEEIFLIRGHDGRCPAWHYILVPMGNTAALNSHKAGSDIDVTDFGCIMSYYDELGRHRSASGWGCNPPRHFTEWLGKVYGVAAADEQTNLSYSEDDIRLCTMVRSRAEQLLGIKRGYWKAGNFHFITLTDNSRTSLAYRSGMKSYDRVISYNGISLENDTPDQFWERFDIDRHLPVQMLVCSPATYDHYKANNRPIHIGLPTVKYLQPVKGIVAVDSEEISPASVAEEGDFCAVKWTSSKTVSVVHISAVQKAKEKIRLFDLVMVATENDFREGQVIWKGSRQDCETLQSPPKPQRSVDHLGHFTSFEDLPNEILIAVFDEIDIEKLYYGFWGLSARINRLLESVKRSSHTIEDFQGSEILPFSHLLKRLVVNTPKPMDLTHFLDLRSLSLKNGNQSQLLSVHPNLCPNLTYLSLAMPFYCSSSSAFSGPVPRGRYANMTHITLIYDRPWSQTSSPRSISIDCSDLILIPFILNLCPELECCQVNTFDRRDSERIDFRDKDFQQIKYPLKRLTLSDSVGHLSSNHLDILLSHLPDLEHVDLTLYSIAFYPLVNNLPKKLQRLRKFDCDITGWSSDSSGDLDMLRLIHPAFQHIQSEVKTSNSRGNCTIFSTKKKQK